MKLKLHSDFRDFYDLWFDRDGDTFERMSRNGMDRKTCMDALAWTLNLPTPRYGLAGELSELHDNALWVLHMDPFAHCGEGKVVLAGGVIRRDHSDDLPVTEYVEAARGRSIRHLQVGRRAWELSYESADDWRSNRGDVSIRVLGNAAPFANAPWPLFAVDFVRDANGSPLAIDLNTAPGMDGTGMADVVKPREVVDEIKGWLSRREPAVSGK